LLFVCCCCCCCFLVCLFVCLLLFSVCHHHHQNLFIVVRTMSRHVVTCHDATLCLLEIELTLYLWISRHDPVVNRISNIISSSTKSIDCFSPLYQTFWLLFFLHGDTMNNIIQLLNTK
jgi:hypothetical protein